MDIQIKFKITSALERISQAFRIMLWEKSKELALSPIQIQIINYISSHSSELITISKLAEIFDLSKATISDSIKLLEKKDIIQRTQREDDNRIQKVILTPYGEEISRHTLTFTAKLNKIIEEFSYEEKNNLYLNLLKIIYQLNRSDVITIQKMCLSCNFYNYEPLSNIHYCQLLKTNLKVDELRIDCPDYDSKI